MLLRQITQDPLAFGREPDQYLAAVLASGFSNNSSGPLQPVDQIYGAVMLDLQAIREFADSGDFFSGQTLDRQEQLMLLWLDAMGARGVLTKTQEAPHLVPELGQAAKGRQSKTASRQPWSLVAFVSSHGGCLYLVQI